MDTEGFKKVSFEEAVKSLDEGHIVYELEQDNFLVIYFPLYKGKYSVFFATIPIMINFSGWGGNPISESGDKYVEIYD